MSTPPAPRLDDLDGPTPPARYRGCHWCGGDVVAVCDRPDGRTGRPCGLPLCAAHRTCAGHTLASRPDGGTLIDAIDLCPEHAGP